jgi:single-stranded-DNA-specific exonuclease
LSLHAKNVEPFRESALGHAAEKLSMEDLVPSALADCEAAGRDVTLQLARELGRLEPCGTGNEAPVLLLSGAELGSLWPLGEAGVHLKGRVNADGRSLEWVWWRGAARVDEFRRGQRVDCLFVPEINQYRGETKLQLSIKDMRAAL